jgi:cytochrome c peroxidase
VITIAPAHRALVVVATASIVAGCSAGTGTAEDTASITSAIGSSGGAAATIDAYDVSGVVRTVDVDGPIDEKNPFFQSLGTNGRSCSSCHVAERAWTITPEHARQRFDATDGLDPLFRPVDGANSPDAPTATREERRRAYSMLLRRAVIRVGLPIPAGAEFELAAVDDPYGHATARELSIFRRPLPSTNLAFLSTVMWDGRETFPGKPIAFDLADQANGATRGHAQAMVDLTLAQDASIVAFETGLFTAQVFDVDAGDLHGAGALGGPEALSHQPFFLGINDPLGKNPTGAPFDPQAFTLYAAWSDVPEPHGRADRREDAREAIARGEALFGGLPIAITGVKGLNDDLAQPVIQGHCTTCHDTPNVGDHSLPAPLDIGIADVSRRTRDMPLYTLRNVATGELQRTTDPGRALVTGRWKDIGRFKGPILRALAARPPYFHDGSASELEDVVDFYDQRFALHLSARDRSDLVAFLRSL